MRILAAVLALSWTAALGCAPLAAQQYIDPEEAAELQLPGEEQPAAEQPAAAPVKARPAAAPAVIQPTLSPAEALKKYEWDFLSARAEEIDRKSTRLNSSHIPLSRMPSSA